MREKLSTEAYKGVRDFYPDDMAIQEHIFNTWTRVVKSYGFEHYDASPLEPAALYRAKTGEEIVNEQTYTFTDRGNREVTLRPEMTPTVARMVTGRRRELSFPLRWYSIPNLFRYERPQRGRLREHWQLNCDIFGAEGVEAEVEIIALAYDIMKAFGAQDDDFIIYINDRALLNKYFSSLNLSSEDTHRMYKLLDRKNKIDTFDEEASVILGRPFESTELETLKSDRLTTCISLLNKFGITNVAFKPSVVRGLDYYDGIVFEIFDTAPENNRALFGGGRYNNLTEIFDNEPIPAVGFGMGDVALFNFLETHALLPAPQTGPALLLLPADSNVSEETIALARNIRNQGISVSTDLSGKKLKDQLARAVKKNTPYVIVVGQDEIAEGTYALKTLATGKETRGTVEEILPHIT